MSLSVILLLLLCRHTGSVPMKLWMTLLAVAGSSFGGAIYSVVDLGGLGGATAAAFSVNSSGVAAGWGDTVQGSTQALVTGSSTLQVLALGSQAYGINDSGAVVGMQGTHGALWTSAGMTDLGANVSAMAINDSGQIAGGNGHAILIGAGGTQDLGTLGGGSWSAAYGLNNTGEVVGSAMLSNGHFEGFTWTQQTGMVSLGTLGGKDSHATAVNNSGQVTGAAALSTGYQHAVLYSNGQAVDLGSLSGTNSYGYAINDSGTVVGYSDITGNGSRTHAFVDAGGMMIDLNSLIAADSGWQLLAAYGINDSGQIVGSGMYDGQSAMFLLNAFAPTSALVLTPALAVPTNATPEPVTGALLAAGLAAVVILRKRRVR
jgi:probable HAF family extracellular repeat protein